MLRIELIAAIEDWDQGVGGTVEPDTRLITSNRLDSLQLVKLMLWIEEKSGRPVDATIVDIASEWDTVDAIVAFVERARGEG